MCALSRGHAKARFVACAATKTYKGLRPGTYMLKVRAVGPGESDQSPASRKFTIGK